MTHSMFPGNGLSILRLFLAEPSEELERMMTAIYFTAQF